MSLMYEITSATRSVESIGVMCKLAVNEEGTQNGFVWFSRSVVNLLKVKGGNALSCD